MKRSPNWFVIRILVASLTLGVASLSAQKAARPRAVADPVAVEATGLAPIAPSAAKTSLAAAMDEASRLLNRLENDTAFAESVRAATQGDQRRATQTLLKSAGFPNSTVAPEGDPSDRTIVITVTVKGVVIIKIVIKI